MTDETTQEEFEAWFNDPVFQRLWTISQDVREGRADAETVEAFEAFEAFDSGTGLEPVWSQRP